MSWRQKASIVVIAIVLVRKEGALMQKGKC
jgi:hypothetical protein